MNINSNLFLNENFDANLYLNDLFLSKLDLQNLNSLNFSSIHDELNALQQELYKAKSRFSEELETCLLVNEINAETRLTEQGFILQEYDQIQALALELEYALTRSDDGTLHLENSLRFLENEKLQDGFTAELLEIFMDFNKPESENKSFEVFCFEKQALFLYILNKVVNNLNNSNEFQLAIEKIKGKFDFFKGKLMLDFKESFWRYDTKRLKSLTNLLEKYGLMNEMSLFFIDTSLQDVKAFKTIMDPKDFDFNCKLFLETLQSIIHVFQRLFQQKTDEFLLSEKFSEKEVLSSNELAIQEIFAEKTSEIVKQIFAYTFDNFLRKGFEFFLEPNRADKGLYLRYLEFLMLNIKHFSAEILLIESPLRSQIRDLNLNYTNALFEEIRNGYYELEMTYFHDKLETKVNQILQAFKNAEHSKKAKPITEDLPVKKKNFSWNSLLQETIFHDQGPNKPQKKVSKSERSRKLTLLKDSALQEIIENCFILLQESSRRCLLISQELNQTLNIYGLLDVFLNNFGMGLIESLINYCEELIPGLNSSKYLEEDFFEIVSRINVYIQRLDLAYSNCTKKLSLINESQDFLTKKDSFIQKFTILLHKTIQNALASIFIFSNKILFEKQKKKDYLEGGLTRTDACGEFIRHLRRYVNVVKQFAFDKTKMSILSSLGTQIISMLSEHFTHYKVNAKGSSILLADFNEYSAFLLEFEDENLKKEWDSFILNARVLTVANEKLEEYIKEKGLENKEIIQKYLKNRA